MAENPRPYKRLPGVSIHAVTSCRLYEGLDHLLQVESTGWTEIYRRFYYRDIQAIVVRQTAWGLVMNILCGFLACLLLIGSMSGSILGSLGPFVTACGLFFWIGISLYLGPTCTVHVRTAVQVERLRSLRRRRTVRKALGRIRPLIAQAQGPASSEA